MTVEEATNYRKKMVENAQSMSDEDALTVPMLFDRWESGKEYAAGVRLYFEGDLYRVLIGHTSQSSWRPNVAPSLYAKVLIPDPDEIPEWEQPGSTNPYMMGDKVRYNSKIWVSIIDYNVWAPGTPGTWSEVEE